MTKIQLFRSLHNSPEAPLILANIWDVGGARLVESLGAKAIATTSAWEHIARLTKGFLAQGDSSLFTHDYMAHSHLQGLFSQAR